MQQFYTLQDLAERWGVTAETARQYTYENDFPACLALSGQTLRWPVAEVQTWEKARREQPKRHKAVRVGRPRRVSAASLPGPALIVRVGA